MLDASTWSSAIQSIQNSDWWRYLGEPSCFPPPLVSQCLIVMPTSVSRPGLPRRHLLFRHALSRARGNAAQRQSASAAGHECARRQLHPRRRPGAGLSMQLSAWRQATSTATASSNIAAPANSASPPRAGRTPTTARGFSLSDLTISSGDCTAVAVAATRFDREKVTIGLA